MAGKPLAAQAPGGFLGSLSHCLGSAPSEEEGAKGNGAVSKFGLHPYCVPGLVLEFPRPTWRGTWLFGGNKATHLRKSEFSVVLI